MKVTCIHCGKTFGITAAHLGGRGYCPHCKGEIVLPSAQETAAAKPEPEHVPPWMATYRALSVVSSFFVHLVIFLLMMIATSWGCQGGPGGPGEGTSEVLIGSLPSETLSTNQDERFQAEETPAEASKSSALTEAMELEAPTSTSDSAATIDVSASPASLSGGGNFDLGAVAIGGGGMAGGGGNWDGMIQSLRRNGLDIVICFDSTGSMGGEISQVKDQIKRIGATLTKLVPKTRIGLVTYRDDKGDEYDVKGTPLTQELQEPVSWLNDIRAGGGGDMPEAVQLGLEYAVSKNHFRPAARKVILLFGDAPPHPEHRQICLQIASDFARQQKGIVSTVTCRNTKRLAEFVEIAQAGGGEAFLTTDEKQIMTQLLVLVFGSQHRGKVVEAFRLMEK